jgi:hypothetical protein
MDAAAEAVLTMARTTDHTDQHGSFPIEPYIRAPPPAQPYLNRKCSVVLRAPWLEGCYSGKLAIPDSHLSPPASPARALI